LPYAQVLNSASIASSTGGTFADSFVINSTDSFAVANFVNGGARMLEAWGIDNLHIAEFEWIYTRPEATHDQQHGWRTSIMAAAFNTVGHVGSVNLLGGQMDLNLFKSDTLAITATSTASDLLVASWITEYDDLPGASAAFISPSVAESMHKSRLGIRVAAIANASTGGLYGTARAFNADDDRLHANTWYAIEGVTMETPVVTISLIGPDWGGQRIGCPAGSINIESSSWFLDQSNKWGKPMIPVFNSNNKGNVLVQTIDTATSTSALIDFQLRELNAPNNWNPSGGIV
jgi:hypothetical protein